MGLVYVTPATEYPVTPDELKLHAHVDGNDEDQNFETYIGAATQLAQRKLDRQLCTASLRLTLDGFPEATRHNPRAAIRIPRPPLASITSIGYVGSDGTTTTMASSDYQVSTSGEPGEVVPAYGTTWPTPRDQPSAVTVVYSAGYGSASAVPKNIKTWILQIGAYLYRQREPVIVGETPNEMPFIDSLLMSEDYGRV